MKHQDTNKPTGHHVEIGPETTKPLLDCTADDLARAARYARAQAEAHHEQARHLAAAAVTAPTNPDTTE
jgi:hypothetical protein